MDSVDLVDRGRTILEVCVGAQSNESILLVYEPQFQSVVDTLSLAARSLGVTKVSRHVYHDQSALNAQPTHDIIIFCVSDNLTLALGHSDIKLKWCSQGCRVGFLTQPLWRVPEKRQLLRIACTTKRLERLLSSATTIEVYTGKPRRTLKVGVQGRRPFGITSLITKPGSWGALPDYAEVAVAPIETSGQGWFTADACIVGLGKALVPVVLGVNCGEATVLSADPLSERLSRLMAQDESAHIVCELGFGTNHLRRNFKGEFDDKKALGSVHLAVGDNHTIGGRNLSKIHVDCVARKCVLAVDGQTVDFNEVSAIGGNQLG
jgi:hypothetical protein